jgi:hypothetical protein
MLIKVRDKKSGNIRTVTQKAYAALGSKVYEKLGVVNDDGTEIGSPNQSTPQVSRSVRGGAAPVVVKNQLVAPKVVEPEVEEEPIEEAPTEPVKAKGKPGPKPKKSISSNSDKNEE